MRVKFIKNGLYGLDGHNVIRCEEGAERECTHSHAAQLIAAGFAVNCAREVAAVDEKPRPEPQPSVEREVESVIRRKRGWWTVKFSDGEESKVRGASDEQEAVEMALAEDK
jgi:hypothetical protein